MQVNSTQQFLQSYKKRSWLLPRLTTVLGQTATTELWDPGALKNRRPNTALGASSWLVKRSRWVGLGLWACSHTHNRYRLVLAGPSYYWTWSINPTGNSPTRLAMTGWPHRADPTRPDGCDESGWDVTSMCSLDIIRHFYFCMQHRHVAAT